MEKKINPIIVQNKIKKAGLKLFSVLDYQRILGINNYGSARSSISRYLKLGIIQKARKGLYFLDDNPPSEFEIANKLYQPSYISFETALSFYGIIPETIFEITSATPKTTRNFTVNSLKFSYKKIKKDCFVGYQPKKIQNVIILMAEPEKALADLLYFIALGKRTFSYERINLQQIKKQKLMNYAKSFNNKKLFELIKNLHD